MPKLLDGLFVLDFSRVLAGPFCAMLLADLGARVVKVEPPEGDEARGIGPFHDGHSLYFASVNRGKQSIALNLKTERGQQIALDLARQADVLIENFRPGTMERLGLAYHRVAAVNPRIVYASISGFGHRGPYSDRGAYDVIIQAMSGLMGITGPEGGPPTRAGASVGDLIPALYGAVAILAALQRRSTTGQGTWIDLAMMDAVFSVTENAVARYWATGTVPGPIGNRHPTITPFSTFTSADGYLVVAAGNDTLWQRLCHTIDRPDLAEDPAFRTNDLRTQHVDRLTDELNRTFCTRPTAEWIDVLLAARIPCGKVNTMADLANDPHLRARNMLLELDHPGLSRVLTPGSPIKALGYDDTPGGPAPAFGEHTDAVIAELLGADDHTIAALRRDQIVF